MIAPRPEIPSARTTLILGYAAVGILVGGFEFRVGSFECMTIPVLTVILRLFWRAATWKCLLVSSIAVFALATAFRYGFIIPLPGTD